MALSQSTLADELEAMTPTAVASVAAQRLATAYGDYMKGAAAGAVPITAAAVDSTAVPAMASAMTFVVGTPASGAAVMLAGVAAFWAAMAAAPPAFFAGATVVTPPTFASLAAALAAAFMTNASGAASLEDAMAALAAAFHAGTAGQGTATLPGPVVTPIA
jgi:hypothetical protein